MKSLLLKLFHSKARLSVHEHIAIKACLQAVPKNVHTAFDKQLSEYNLIQREVSDKVLNFYKCSLFGKLLEPSVLLPIQTGEVLLSSFTLVKTSRAEVLVKIHCVNRNKLSASENLKLDKVVYQPELARA
ncbi:hypothetical protein EP12_18190 [Alteromonas australica]|nr:hypothetical protein EP12_18190 [Alteromonas australica]